MNIFKQSLGQWFSAKAPVLGSREIEVLKVLWRDGEQSAQAIHHELMEADISLSTVQSTLERLYRKHLVSREKIGRYFVYQAKMDQSALVCDFLKDLTAQISDGNMAPVISGFMDYMAESGKPVSPPFDKLATDNSDEVTANRDDDRTAKSDSVKDDQY